MISQLNTGYEHYYLFDGKSKLIRLVKSLCSEQNVDVHQYDSTKTESMYFRLKYCGSCTTFRISNHYPKTNWTGGSLILCKSTKKKTIERFILKEISKVKIRSVKKLCEGSGDLCQYQ